jgi:hypothetical protein
VTLPSKQAEMAPARHWQRSRSAVVPIISLARSRTEAEPFTGLGPTHSRRLVRWWRNVP